MYLFQGITLLLMPLDVGCIDHFFDVGADADTVCPYGRTDISCSQVRHTWGIAICTRLSISWHNTMTCKFHATCGVTLKPGEISCGYLAQLIHVMAFMQSVVHAYMTSHDKLCRLNAVMLCRFLLRSTLYLSPNPWKTMVRWASRLA